MADRPQVGLLITKFDGLNLSLDQMSPEEVTKGTARELVNLNVVDSSRMVSRMGLKLVTFESD